MAHDLQAESNKNYRLFEKFSKESTVVSIAGIALVISIVFAIIAVLAMNSSSKSMAIAETWQTLYNETERECRLAQMEVDDFRIVLIKAGLDVDHVGEKP